MGHLYRPKIRHAAAAVQAALGRLGVPEPAAGFLLRHHARGETWARLAASAGAPVEALRGELAHHEAALRAALPERRSSVYFARYYVNGRPVCESTRATRLEDARRFVKEREGRAAEGRPVAPRAERVTLGELFEDLKAEYRANARRSLERLEFSLAHLKPFAARRAHEVTAADVKTYVSRRLEAGAAPATANRELAALRRAYRLGIEHEKIHHMPKVKALREHNVRTGFFEPDQFQAVRRQLPEHLRPVVTFAQVTGWRVQSEILPLRWRQVDFRSGTIRLEPGETKNSEGRVFVMTPELRATLEAQRATTEELQRKLEAIIPWVFHRRGRPIKNFRGAWKVACRAAGIPGRIPHDFRRTAVRNMERAGVPRSVAMKMVGHKTEAVYRRYAIVVEADLREAALKLAALGSAVASSIKSERSVGETHLATL